MNCKHKRAHKVILKDKIEYECDFCGKRITSFGRKLMNGFIRYKQWKGVGYGFTAVIKEIIVNIVQGGMLLTSFKVLFNINVSFKWVIFYAILEQIIEVILGWWLIYKAKYVEAEADYTQRTQEIAPVGREFLDNWEEIKKDIKEIKQKL